MQARIGISPISWWNDDLPELSCDISVEECFRQASGAGYAGMETGQRFPRDPAVLGPVLERHRIGICGGWHSGRLLDGSVAEEKDRVAEQLALFLAVGAPCIVYGETAGSIQGDRNRPLSGKRRPDEAEIRRYGHRLTEFAEWLADEGMPISFHHHMAAPVETEAELDLLMNHTGEAVRLLYDAGHMAFAGGDVLRVIDRHHGRINHVHAKDIRQGVIDRLDRDRHSFLDAVLQGAFTVPGDGSLDFAAIVRRLAGVGYEGWFVVEAEQDPADHPPEAMARKGQEELVRVLAAAGYEVVS